MLVGSAKKTKSAPKPSQHNKKLLFCLIIVIALLVIFWARDLTKETIRFGSKALNLEIVNTDELREKGLSGRESLAQNAGMLFEFDQTDQHCFWMRDMNFPIDIIWLDEHKKVVHIKENAQPSSYPERFCPETPSAYVLEVQAGLVRQENITVGSQL